MQCARRCLRLTKPPGLNVCTSNICEPAEKLQSTMLRTVCLSGMRHVCNRSIKFRTINSPALHLSRNLHVSQTVNDVPDRQLAWFEQALVKSDTEIKAVQEVAPEMVESMVERKARKKRVFLRVIDAYLIKEDKNRRGHVDFIHACLAKMEEFGVHRDLEVYKKVVDVFPKTVMIPRTVWQVEFMHFPKQQECAMDIMTQMTRQGVMPDQVFAELLCAVFGEKAHAFRKLRRILYWMPKFRNLNPHPVPLELPMDPIQQAIIALKRMAVDYENKIDVWKTKETEIEPLEDTFVVSAQSPTQQKLLTAHPTRTPLYVEGGYLVWLREVSHTYFVLRADANPKNFEKPDPKEEDSFEFETIFESEDPKGPKELMKRLSDHEQDDGTILAMCITGSGTKDSLITWIRYLQKTNPNLGKIQVVFTLRTPHDFIQLYEADAQEVAKQT